jgi:CO dehydrogenase maturation factor
MYAGVEHLGRATVDFVDAMIIVVEPTQRSLGTAGQIQKLARDIGLDRLWLAGNKIRTEEEIQFLKQSSLDIPLLGTLPLDLGVLDADREGKAVYSVVPSLKNAAVEMAEKIAQPYPKSIG